MNGLEDANGSKKRRLARRGEPSEIWQQQQNLMMSNSQEQALPAEEDKEGEVLGRDDVSVRFLWKEARPAAAIETS